MSFDVDPYITLLFAGQDVDTDAWYCVNKQDLLDALPAQRRDNVELFGVDGRLGRRTFDDETTVDLRWVMTGVCDPTGTEATSPHATLKANKRDFADRYFRVTRDSYGCFSCTAVDVDGEAAGGDIQTDAPKFSEGLFECVVVMSVTIPAGELVVGGS
jgi:hypothetical protein